MSSTIFIYHYIILIESSPCPLFSEMAPVQCLKAIFWVSFQSLNTQFSVLKYLTQVLK